MSKQIGMFESKDWVYQVNNSQDSTPPSLKKCTMKYKDSDDNLHDLTVYNSSQTFDTSRDWAQNVYTFTPRNDKKIYIELEAFDDGSEPASYFDIVMYRFYDRQYNYISPNNITTIRTDFTTTGTTSTYKGELDLSGYTEGVYTLNFIIYDNNGSSSIWPKSGTNNEINTNGYFIIDNGVYLDKPVIEDSSPTLSNLKVSWTPPADFSKVRIDYIKKEGNETQWTNASEITDFATTSYEFTTLEYATDYFFELIFEDINGNSQPIILIDYTRPAQATWGDVEYDSTTTFFSLNVNIPSPVDTVSVRVYKDKNFTDLYQTYSIPTTNNTYLLILPRSLFYHGNTYTGSYYCRLETTYKDKKNYNAKVYRIALLASNCEFMQIP